MIPRKMILRVIVLVFMGMIGFTFANSIYTGSTWGLILAALSLVAAVSFLYILAKARQEMEREQS